MKLGVFGNVSSGARYFSSLLSYFFGGDVYYSSLVRTDDVLITHFQKDCLSLDVWCSATPWFYSTESIHTFYKNVDVICVMIPDNEISYTTEVDLLDEMTEQIRS